MHIMFVSKDQLLSPKLWLSIIPPHSLSWEEWQKSLLPLFAGTMVLRTHCNTCTFVCVCVCVCVCVDKVKTAETTGMSCIPGMKEYRANVFE